MYGRDITSYGRRASISEGEQSGGALIGLHLDGVPMGITNPYVSLVDGNGKSVLMKCAPLESAIVAR